MADKGGTPAEVAGDNVVIHTMQDDLAGKVPARPVAITPSVAAATKPGPTVPAPPSPVAAAPAALRGQFPLPPKPSQAKGPPPAFIPRRRQRGKLIWVFLPLLLVVLAGAYAYFFWLPTAPDELPTPVAEIAELSQVIPGSAAVVAQYHVATPDARSQFLELWQGSVKPLLQGNPENLLTQGNVTEFAYVMLEDNTRPFLIVPKDSLPAEIVASLNELQLAEVSGWHVVHAVSAAPYAEALQAGRLAPRMPGPAGQAGVEVSLSQAALNQLRSHIASPSFGAGQLTSLTVTLSPIPSGKALRVNGVIPPPSSPTPTAATIVARADQSLLEQVPADAIFVRLGASLKQDIATWQTVANILDNQTLTVPAVAALATQLDTPYAYYHRSGSDGVNDVGLVVVLPPTLDPPLSLGDATLEQALTALLPLVSSGRPAATLRFTDALYQGTPLRFVNIAGSTEALDYAIEKDKLFVSSSKEGMFAILDTTSGRAGSLPTGSPWQSLLTEWQTIPETEHLFFGFAEYTPLLELLPSEASRLPVGLAIGSTTTPTLSGILLLNISPASSPSPTP